MGMSTASTGTRLEVHSDTTRLQGGMDLSRDAVRSSKVGSLLKRSR